MTRTLRAFASGPYGSAMKRRVALALERSFDSTGDEPRGSRAADCRPAKPERADAAAAPMPRGDCDAADGRERRACASAHQLAEQA